MSNSIEYDLDSLKVGIEKCYDNIKIFEDAISKENATIHQYQRMIAQLEVKKASE